MEVLLVKKGSTENDFHIGLEEREVGNDIVQVNFHPQEFKDVSALCSYSEM